MTAAGIEDGRLLRSVSKSGKINRDTLSDWAIWSIVEQLRLHHNAKRYTLYVMIQSFKCANTHSLFTARTSKLWSNVQNVALRKLDQIQAASLLTDLKVPPGNRLEALKKDRKGRHSIRINDQWRICFVWKTDGAHDVEITDYH
jgi:toxin HigB-1